MSVDTWNETVGEGDPGVGTRIDEPAGKGWKTPSHRVLRRIGRGVGVPGHGVSGEPATRQGSVFGYILYMFWFDEKIVNRSAAGLIPCTDRIGGELHRVDYRSHPSERTACLGRRQTR